MCWDQFHAKLLRECAQLLKSFSLEESYFIFSPDIPNNCSMHINPTACYLFTQASGLLALFMYNYVNTCLQRVTGYLDNHHQGLPITSSVSPLGLYILNVYYHNAWCLDFAFIPEQVQIYTSEGKNGNYLLSKLSPGQLKLKAGASLEVGHAHDTATEEGMPLSAIYSKVHSYLYSHSRPFRAKFSNSFAHNYDCSLNTWHWTDVKGVWNV